MPTTRIQTYPEYHEAEQDTSGPSALSALPQNGQNLGYEDTVLEITSSDDFSSEENCIDPATTFKTSSAVDKSAIYCALCLRECAAELMVEADFDECQDKLQHIFSSTLNIKRYVICRMCWKVTKMLADFKECCLKAESWSTRYASGIKYEESADVWLKENTMQMIDQAHQSIQDQLERIECEILAAKSVETEPEEINEEDEFDWREATNTNEQFDCEVVLDSSEESNDDEYICEKCHTAFGATMEYTTHVQNCTGSSGQPFLHRCSMCHISFTEHRQLTYHLNKHRGVKPFRCRRRCNERFFSPVARHKHEKNCGREKFSCTLCGAQFQAVNVLFNHFDTAHPNHDIRCNICRRIFKTRRYLERHMLVHTDERGFPCNMCNKAFKTAYSAQIHVRVHHSRERPYACKLCNKTYGYKCLLKTHVRRIHGKDLR